MDSVKYSADDERVLVRCEYWKNREQLIKVANNRWIVYTRNWLESNSHPLFNSRAEAVASLSNGSSGQEPVFIVHCGQENASDRYWSVRAMLLQLRSPPSQEWVLYCSEPETVQWFSSEIDAWDAIPFDNQVAYHVARPGFDIGFSSSYSLPTYQVKSSLPSDLEVMFGTSASFCRSLIFLSLSLQISPMETERIRLVELGFEGAWITKHLSERHARDITQSFEHWVEDFLDVLSTCEDDNVHKLFQSFTESARRQVASDWACHADCGLTQHLVEWVRGRL